mmetsp:Transcript_86932/g.177068  ORF Transcript_86932/g.177068 Transcript_86932/m.177068 type:complete len:237 (-) Transcript_86932:70-780(-)
MLLEDCHCLAHRWFLAASVQPGSEENLVPPVFQARAGIRHAVPLYGDSGLFFGWEVFYLDEWFFGFLVVGFVFIGVAVGPLPVSRRRRMHLPNTSSSSHETLRCQAAFGGGRRATVRKFCKWILLVAGFDGRWILRYWFIIIIVSAAAAAVVVRLSIRSRIGWWPIGARLVIIGSGIVVIVLWLHLVPCLVAVAFWRWNSCAGAFDRIFLVCAIATHTDTNVSDRIVRICFASSFL